MSFDRVLTDSKELEFKAEAELIRAENKYTYVGYIWGLDVEEEVAYLGQEFHPIKLKFKVENGLPVGGYFIMPSGLTLKYNPERHHIINYMDVEEELYVRGDYE